MFPVAMMIDFEDRTPARPMSWGERALLVVIVAMTIYGLAGSAMTAWAWIGSLFS